MRPGDLVAVTGATGFIGNYLCRRLLAQGYRVRALVRNPARATDLAAAGISLVEGDLDNLPALVRLVTGCDAVVHGAGAVRGNSQEDFDRVNVDGTARLLAALDTVTPPPRLLLLSSLAASQPQLSWYARSKRRSEELLREAPNLDWIILRPPPVYGPGDREMLPIFRTMRRGIATVPGSTDARTSLIHVSDLAGALVACLESAGTSGETFNLSDGREHGYSWREMADIASELWARRVRLWRVPGPLLDTLAALNSRLAALTGRAPMLTPPKLRELRHPDWVVDNRAITNATGWHPATGLREGLEQLNL